MEIHFLMLVIMSTYMGLVVGEDNDAIPYQSFCDPSTNNGECSNNLRCRCSSLVPTGERICTLQVQCASAVPCNWNNKCNKTNSVCVIDNRCDGQRLCYPISFTDPDICPPLMTNDNINNDE